MPKWFDANDRKKYEELIDKSFKKIELTKEENDFLIDMYHQEEFYAYGEL